MRLTGERFFRPTPVCFGSKREKELKGALQQPGFCIDKTPELL
ncbi:hypothetical protein [Hominisplanchenecus murintestinalis]|nr:hypothetical protein [Hominisplanchenecus murintestinalis]